MSFRTLRLSSGSGLVPFISLAIAFGLVACGGGVSSDPASTGGATSTGGGSNADLAAETPEEFIENYPKVLCEKLACAPTAKAGALENCLAHYERLLSSADPSKDVRFGYDKAAGKACLEGLASSSCDDSYEFGVALSSCSDAFRPMGATEGKACVEGTCANSDLFCDDGGDDATCGVCTKKGGENALCGSSSECGKGLTCDFGTCVEGLGRGEDCSDSTKKCAPDLICSEEGKCGPPHGPYKLGDVCGAETSCEIGAFCQWGGDGICVGPAEANGDCDSTFPDSCPRDQACSAAIGSSGKCEPLAKEGGACVNLYQCEPMATCLSGKCVFPKVSGEQCANDAECSTGHCGASGKCEAKPDACE